MGAKISGAQKAKKATPSSPIGIFDSGVGGLTVLAQVLKQLPNEDYIYLADTARVPYGGRSPQEIIKINQEIIPFLINQGAKLIIMACGTSSAIAYPVVKDEYAVELINLIEAGSRAALSATKNKQIGVIATAGTVNSGAFQNKIGNEAQVQAVACPLFVPLVEDGLVETDETRKVAKEYLKPLISAGIDTLILGCTHYPHLSKVIKEIVGPSVTLVDPAVAAVAQAKAMLKKAGTIKTTGSPAKASFLVTGSAIHFQDVGSRLLGKAIVGAKQVKLG